MYLWHTAIYSPRRLLILILGCKVILIIQTSYETIALGSIFFFCIRDVRKGLTHKPKDWHFSKTLWSPSKSRNSSNLWNQTVHYGVQKNLSMVPNSLPDEFRQQSPTPISPRCFLHTYRTSWYYQSFIHQLMHKWTVLKTILKFTLKFTLKQLRHVSVQLHHHQGAHYSCLLQLQLLKQPIKINRCVVMWLHIYVLVGVCTVRWTVRK